MTRYPLASLAAACGLSEHALCQRLGVKGSDGQRAIREGLSELLADRYAVKMGLHSAVVWPELMDAAIEAVHRDCAAPDCTARFVPRTRTHRFCSDRCRQRVKQRRYRSTPSGADNNRKWRRSWYAECAEYDKGVSRKRRERLRERGMAA